MNKAVLKSCGSYNVEQLIPCIEYVIDAFGGAEYLFKKGKKVVIKPNLVMKKTPESAAITHPAVIEALVMVLKKYTDDITIAECPGGVYSKDRINSIYKTAGYTDLAQRTGITLCSEVNQVTVNIKDGSVAKNVTVLQEFVNADVLINVSKLKTHGLTVMTGTAKNLYGLIPGLEKAQIHSRFPDKEVFADFICDINSVFKPTINILDAIMCMEGNGPTGGDPRFAGFIIASDVTFAADITGAKLININPKDVPILAHAVKRGLCSEQIETVGDSFEPITDFKASDSHSGGFISLLTKASNKHIRKIVTPRPKINRDLCIGCGECVQCCPQKTISLVNKKARINNKNCIFCYCCQELCPRKAVEIKKLFIFNLLK